MQKFKPQSCIRIFFPTNPPYPRHPVLNSCFGSFHSVWVHLGPFRYCTKLGAKWAELVRLMQKFVPQSHVGCFHNERTQSPPHWNLNSVPQSKLSAKWAELVQLMQKFVPRSWVGSFRNERT